jgi:predicted  nucleic acid-binding Zn-ribbon protein
MVMTQATDQDIREIKGAIDAIAKGTEANTKAIADLVASVGGLREEMRVGFSNVETKLADVRGDMKVIDTRLGNLESRMNGLESSAQKVSDLAEKVGELKNWKQIAIVVFTASVSSAIAWFLRSGRN